MQLCLISRKLRRKLLNDKVVDLSKDEQLNTTWTVIFHVNYFYFNWYCQLYMWSQFANSSRLKISPKDALTGYPHLNGKNSLFDCILRFNVFKNIKLMIYSMAKEVWLYFNGIMSHSCRLIIYKFRSWCIMAKIM